MVDMVRGAPEALVKQNAFYLHVKMLLGQRTQEIIALKEVNVSLSKDFNDLKVRYETLEKAHQ